MNECPLCGQVCEGPNNLTDHLMRAHHDMMLGDPARRMVSASAKRDGFAGFYCWCGDPVYLMPGEDGSDAFIQHCADWGGITPHLLGLMLGVTDDGA